MRPTTMAAATFLVLTLSLPALAAEPTLQELDRRILTCDSLLKNILTMPDRGIPRDLLRKCRGLAIFPGVVRVGVVVGISYGRGLVLRRHEKTGEWSKPAFFRIRGGSLGAQVGAQSIDLVLLIMSEDGMRGLLEDKFTLGADIAVAAGPVGREASAETNLRFDSGILSYSRSKGLFAGLALTGAVLEPDTEANTVYYGKDVSVQDVFYEGLGALTDNGRILVKTLEDATK
jgi:SH3 domain-containing YSC84-like protein 1